MKRRAWVLVPALLLLCNATAPLAEGNANFVIGGRTLDDEDFWRPGEDQFVFGATVSFGERDWPISLAAGTHVGVSEEDTRFFGFTETWRTVVVDFSFGVRKVWKAGRTRPYVGGGLAAVFAAVELEAFGTTVDDDDHSGGGYLEGGVFWRLGSSFNIGFELRSLFGTDVSFDFGGPVSVNGDADYGQFTMVLGWGWPPD